MLNFSFINTVFYIFISLIINTKCCFKKDVSIKTSEEHDVKVVIVDCRERVYRGDHIQQSFVDDFMVYYSKTNYTSVSSRTGTSYLSDLSSNILESPNTTGIVKARIEELPPSWVKPSPTNNLDLSANKNLHRAGKTTQAVHLFLNIFRTKLVSNCVFVDSKALSKLTLYLESYLELLQLSCSEIKEMLVSLLIDNDSLLRQSLPTNTLLDYVDCGPTPLTTKLSQNQRIILFFLDIFLKKYSRCSVCYTQEQIFKSSKSFLWVNFEPSQDLNNSFSILRNKKSFFKVSSTLAHHLAQEYGLLYIQFLTTENHLNSVRISTKNYVKHLISLSIATERGEHIKHLPAPVDLYFRYDRGSELQGVNHGFAEVPSSAEPNKDDYIKVFKLKPFELSGSGTIFVKFHNLSGNSFNVLLLTNVRPDHELMALHSTPVLREYPVYKVDFEHQTKNHLYYLGILPKSKTSVVGKVPYSFVVTYAQCYSKLGEKWVSDGCKVGDETNNVLIHCKCWHLSLFGGSVAISPKELNLENDIKLLLKVKDNPKPFIVVCSLVLLYFMVLVWTRHNDSKDRLQRFVIVLEDNFPGEEWAYLVTVYTGFWIGSGTDANVGIRLYGSKGISRIHNLQSRKRKVLKGNCDDWFLMFTPRSLGDIERIHIFHDNTGESADWYCAKVMVYDIEGQKDFKFIVQKWVSLSEEDEFIECIAYPTPTLKSVRRDRLAVDNVIFGLRETHLLLSIFTRHPRSSVTRSQRLSICICIIIVHLLTSIMFFGLEQGEYPQYSSHMRTIIIGIESTLLASPFTFIVIFCFKKSRIVTVSKSNVPMTLTSTQAVPLETGLQVNQSKSPVSDGTLQDSSSESDTSSSLTPLSGSSESGEEEMEDEEDEVEESCWKNCYKQFQALLFQVIISKAVMPVKIAEEDEESAYVRKQWMYFAWFLCETAIFVGGLFIVIYSLKMDQKDTNDWLHFAFKISFTNVFLLAPMKIIIFATILAILYGQLQYVPSYECNTELAIKKELMGNERYLAKILKIRQNQWYHPLKYKEVFKIRMKEKNWRRWRLIANFLALILLYFVLLMEVLITWDGLYLQTYNHLENMFKPTQKITSFDIFKKYLEETVYPSLNKPHWYNGEEVNLTDIWKQELGMTKDYATKLVSYPRIRQQRVTADSCTVPTVMQNKFFQCNAPMNWFNMDTKDYSITWTQPEKTSSDSDSPWMFSESYSPPIICGYGTGMCYLPGGYTVTLSYNNMDSLGKLDFLCKSEWFDGLTRVVFVELVLFNINTELICYVSLMLEKLADGSFHYFVKAEVLHPRSSGFIESIVFLLIYIFYYFFRIVMLFNRKGLTYLFSWAGLLDIFLNVLLYITLTGVYCYRHARISYLEQWQLNQEEDLTMRADIFFHRYVLRFEIAILVIIIPAELLHNFRFGRKTSFFFRTWNYCVRFGFGLAFTAFCYYIGLKLLTSIVTNKSDLVCPFSRCFSPTSSYHLVGQHIFSSHVKLLTFLFCFIINVTAFLATVSAIYSYREVKAEYYYCDDFNMFSFIWEKVNKGIKKLLKIKRHFYSFTDKRFRAGAEDESVANDTVYHWNRSYKHTKLMCYDLTVNLNAIVKKLKKIEKSL